MRFLVSLCLALLLFLPGQVCASALCLHDMASMPCHGAHKQGQAPMLQQDCAKSVLQASASFTLEQPPVYTAPPFVLTVAAPLNGVQVQDFRLARGPPDGTRLRACHQLSHT